MAGLSAPPNWQEFRRAMPIAQRWAYFDHAAVAPLSGPASEAVRKWASEAATEGDVAWGGWSKRVEEVRRLAADLIGAGSDEVALVHNTTEGIGFVAEGFPWREGDNVVTLASEFPSNVYPWMNLASRGVDCRMVPCELERLDLSDLEHAIDARTRLVSVSWVGYATGWRNDLDELAELVHRRGAVLFVDAIQGLGVLPIDVGQTPIDFLAADGHKWLLAPEGAGVFYVRREHLERLRPMMVGWNSVVGSGDFSRLNFQLKPDAARYEGGSLNMSGILALGASLDLLARFGTPAIAERLFEVTDHLCERLAAIGAEIVSAREPRRKSGIVSFTLPGHDSQRVRASLGRRAVVVNCRGGRLRASPHAYTAEEDIERLVEGLQAVD